MSEPTGASRAGDAIAAAARSSSSPRADFRRRALLAVVLVAALVYANAVLNNFTLDDRGVILKNPLVASLSGVWRGWVHSYWPENLPGGQYRPLVIASFSIDWAIGGGRAAWFHFVNVLWHVAVCVLVFLLAAELFSPAAALGAALLFAVHPVHVEAVANTVGRCEIMAAAFALLALRSHRRGSWWAIGWFVLALASKENGIVFVGLAMASDLILDADWRAALVSRRRLYAGYLAVAAGYAATLFAVFHGRRFVVPAPTWHGASVVDRLLTVATVVPQYARLMLAPFSLAIDYNPKLIELSTTVTPMVVAGCVLAVGFVVWLARAWTRSPRVAFALAVFAVSLSPVSNILFPSGIVLAERTLYLPSVAIALLAAAAFDHLAARRLNVSIAVGVAILGAFAIRTWTRTPVWHDNKTMVLTSIRDHPESYRVRASAGAVLAQGQDWAGAERELRTARELFQGDWTLYRESAEVFINDSAQGPRRFEWALAMLDTAIDLDSSVAGAWLRRAEVRYLLGSWRGAMADARRAFVLEPDTVRAVVVLGESARQIGDIDAAERGYRDAVAVRPEAWEGHTGLADVLLGRGDTVAARREAEAGVRLSGGNATATAVLQRAVTARPPP
jgi:protein O-mannosyl-transferase